MQSVKQLITKMATSISKNKGIGGAFTVAVEGNMGSGKTTFLEHFRKYDGICILAEPVEHWRNVNGYNLLGLMYEDPKKWSFAFQSYVQLTMLENHLKPTPHPIKLMERSIYSARYCFVEKLTQDGLLPAPSAAVIDKWFQWLTTNKNIDVDLIVYLRTTPEVVYERILKRQRPEEKTVSLDYIKSLHQIHEDWLYNKTLHKCPAPTLVLDANKDKSVLEAELDRLEPHILNKIPLEAQAF